MKIHQSYWRSGLRVLVLTALVLGLFFRVTHLGQKVYWHDEVFTSIRASGYTAEEIIPDLFSGRLITPDALLQYQQLSPERGWDDTWYALTTHPEHPPLYYLLARLWMEWFGSSVAVVRSLSVLFSLLAFPALYWVCRELFDWPLVWWVAIGLFAVSPFHVLYAQEARQSSLWTLVTLLSIAALLRAMRVQTGASWALYAVTVALNVYTFLLSGIVLMVHGLIVLLARPFSWQTLRRFSIALLVGLLAFTPWIRVLIRNWLALQSKTLWTTASPPKSLLAKLWGLHFSSDFIDLGLPLDHLYTYLIPPMILALLGCAFWVLCRHTPSRTRLPIVLLVGLPVIVLILPDILLGGQRSLNTRYFVPALIGAQLAVAYFLSDLIQQPSAWVRQLGRGLLALLLTVGIISCSLSWRSETWWSKGTSYYNPAIATLLNQIDHPVVIGYLGDTTLGNIISLSYWVKPEVRFQLLIDAVLPPKPAGLGDRFLVHPPAPLMQHVQATSSVQLEPVVSEDIPLFRLVEP